MFYCGYRGPKIRLGWDRCVPRKASSFWNERVREIPNNYLKSGRRARSLTASVDLSKFTFSSDAICWPISELIIHPRVINDTPLYLTMVTIQVTLHCFPCLLLGMTSVEVGKSLTLPTVDQIMLYQPLASPSPWEVTQLSLFTFFVTRWEAPYDPCLSLDHVLAICDSFSL